MQLFAGLGPGGVEGELTGSERFVARLLREIDEDGAFAFYSTRLRRARRKREAEVDFLVLWKGRVLVLEVKGGDLGRDGSGRWYLDAVGYPRRFIENPIDQAREGMYALRDLILELDHFDIRDATTYAAVTPFSDRPPSSPGWHETQWIDRATDTPERLAQALDALADLTPKPLGRGSRDLVRLRDRLAREFVSMAAFDAERKVLRGEQDRLTQEQVRVLVEMSGVDRSIVQGGAGTGKSVALALVARQRAEMGERVLVTYRAPTLTPLFRSRLAGSAVEFAPLQDLRSCTVPYDFVLVDEAQDVMNEEDMSRIMSLVTGGFDKGSWMLALDPNNQAQVDGLYDNAWYAEVRAGTPVFPLSRNVRNTKAMVDAVTSSLLADIGSPAVAQGRAVRWDEVTSPTQVGKRVRSALDEPLRRVAGDGDATTAVVISVAGATDRAIQEIEMGAVSFGSIPCISAKMAKGLEYDHVVVIDIPANPNPAELSAVYVAMTRARVSLSLVVDAATKAWMKLNARRLLEQTMGTDNG